MLGGVLSVAEGLLILFNPEYYHFGSPLDYLVVALEGAALLVLLGALSGLHAAQSGGYGVLWVRRDFSRPSPAPYWPSPGTWGRFPSSTSSTAGASCTFCSR